MEKQNLRKQLVAGVVTLTIYTLVVLVIGMAIHKFFF